MTSEGLGEMFEKVTLQTHAPENFRSCSWGDETNGQARSDGERGSPSGERKFKGHSYKTLIASFSLPPCIFVLSRHLKGVFLQVF